MKSFLGWISHKAPIFLTYLVLLSAVGVLFVYKQNSLIPGANTYEQAIAERVEFYEYPWRISIDAPYITTSWIVSKLFFADALVAARFVSAVAGVLSVLMFYHVLRNWLLSPGKALVGTILFATSSWMMVLSRGAHSATVGIFLLLLIFTFGTRLLFTTKPFIDWLLLTTATVLSLYTPLVPWLVFMVGALSMLHYKQRQRSLPLKLWQKIFLWFLAITLITPLVWSLFINTGQLKELLGVSELVDTIPMVILNMLDALKQIFFIGDISMPLGLGTLPMLDILSVFMFLLGCYYFERRLSLKRSKLLFGGFVIALAVCSLSTFSFAQYSMLIPLVYIFVSAGIHESITRWLSVFPRNPIARSVGVIVLAIAIGFVSSYHLRKVFIARPGNPEVRALYQAN